MGNVQTTQAATVIRYRGERITYTPGFALAYMWLGTLGFKTLDDAKRAIDAAPWNAKGK